MKEEQMDRRQKLMTIAFRNRVPTPPPPLGFYNCSGRYIMPTDIMWEAWLKATQDTLESFGIKE